MAYQKATHEGKTYHRTGKKGTNIQIGKRVAEMNCHYIENGFEYEARIWIDADGKIYPD